MKVDWNGTLYLGITLAWNYTVRTVDLSMPGYVQRALTRFNHPRPTRDQHARHSWVSPQYGAVTQFTEDPDDSEPLVASNLKRLQQIIGVFLYYARILDSTMLVTLGTFSIGTIKRYCSNHERSHPIVKLCGHPYRSHNQISCRRYDSA